MAEPKQARVIANLSLESPGALLAFQMDGDSQVPLLGGKYIIINTGLSNEEGKLIKRAYSLFAVNQAAQQFFLAAERVPGGIASQYLFDLQLGDTLTFSGPWGRFFWPEGAAEKQLVAAAFGSGITVILGYLASVPADCEVHLYWYQEGARALVNDSIVAECAADKKIQIIPRNFEDDPTLDLSQWEYSGVRFITAGEGVRADRFLDHLRHQGVTDDRLQSEIFYRQPVV